MQLTKNVVIDIADMKVSNNPEDILVTYALGSCIGVALYDPVVKVGGLVHVMLPESNLENGTGGVKNPYKYIDTGVPRLYKKMYEMGAQKKRIENAVIGGSQIMDDSGFFNIGKRNYAALRKLFWKNNVLINRQHVGGRINRTVKMEVATGRILVKLSSGETIEL
ncbi:MAG: chemotaxis protein CheD [Candidatus Marinimicrobia bacterium]|nr:chemotaxis protein CheD [Candidatus Neomarinimicrobiota bacterium]